MPKRSYDRAVRFLLVVVTVDAVVALALRAHVVAAAAHGSWGWEGGLAAFGLLLLGPVAVALWRVVSRMHLLQRSVTDQQEHLAALAATSRDWQWESDLRLVFTSCSPGLSDTLGYTPAQVLGRSFLDLVDPADHLTAETVLAQAIASGTGWADVELRWRHADGHLLTLQGSAVPVRDEWGRVTGFRGTRRRAAADLDAQRRLAAITKRTLDVLADRSLQIALQPIISVGTGTWCAVEALARFPDQRPPDVWFAEAHEAGLGRDLELLAVETALETLAVLPSDIGLSVNASPAVILDPLFSDLLHQHRVPLHRLTVEVTEHVAVPTYDDLHTALALLREQGLQVAVDDTGAGYASFTHVLQLRPDTIKLDRSLLADITTDPARRALVTAIVLLALELDATITAEGVETAEELRTISSLGIDCAQGYHLARPSTDPSRWLRWRTRNWDALLRSPARPDTAPADRADRR